jgi:hypothetical protein
LKLFERIDRQCRYGWRIGDDSVHASLRIVIKLTLANGCFEQPLVLMEVHEKEEPEQKRTKLG